MIDWRSLNHAYGSAADVPDLIERWAEAGENDEALNELWSRLCHQSTVHSASFAAIPVLIKIGAGRGGEKARDAVNLVGSILASRNVRGERRIESDSFRDFVNLSERCLTHDVDDTEFIYLMQALAAARASPPWDRLLSGLIDEELEGKCEGCESNLLFALGSEGYFAAADDYVRKLDVRRWPITPAEAGRLPEKQAWLEQVPLAHGHAEVARKVCYLFGDTRCPVCDARVNVAAAIDALLGSSANAR